MHTVIRTAALLLLLLTGLDGWGEEVGGEGALRVLSPGELQGILPSDTRLLLASSAIEQFLRELDGYPPDWATVYGHGHDDPAFDDRLFALNRERDTKRLGRSALSGQVAFAWVGVLSPYNAECDGFSVALGPKFTKTSWGMVRFKPEDLPGNLVVKADSAQREQLQRQVERGNPVEIDVVMSGQLIPDESIVYDFSHDEEGLGLIMPLVRVERVYYVIVPERN
jgi:hypothetical protein